MNSVAKPPSHHRFKVIGHFTVMCQERVSMDLLICQLDLCLRLCLALRLAGSSALWCSDLKTMASSPAFWASLEPST